MNSFDLSLYLVTDSAMLHGRSLENVVSEAVRGGVTMVQLREKDISTKQFLELALRLKKCLEPYNVPLIINDRLDIALVADADGLHIGQNDIPYESARKWMGKDKIIGLSVENMDDALRANATDVDYIGISPVFGTPTKTDTAQPLGLDGVEAITKISKHPTVGIGGMNIDTAKQVIAAGADGIAVVSAIIAMPDPYEAAAKLNEIVKKQKYEME